ncbi:hypothetical protein HBI56_224520 [Parastagonospora nodorum]|nr:hypothetical protein HBH52_187520 [Parastagonospora nodorum]KAH4013413.1 hypothetical protein HBI09_218000 [Parastagonospora nodorum]KAH4084929.1 hypothetical protein HBH46_210240 [Parastagonospora nodorum]KAH4112735.1 hypothetical protein HBH47_220620 [Parastagonospora nodorum]KAH4181447.1 hypothetical protein HBH42_235700 [Parastagonospora nodorum]
MATHAGTVKDAGDEYLATPAPAAAAAAAQNPRAQAHPYIHRHEVDAHLAAIRAGAPVPPVRCTAASIKRSMWRREGRVSSLVSSI